MDFGNLISREAHQQRNSIRNPIIRVFHSWMCKRVLGRMRETKVTDMELNWLYSALIARQLIDPSYLMINRWCCEATSGAVTYWFGVLPLYVGLLPATGDRKKPRTSFARYLSRHLSTCDKANILVEARRGGYRLATCEPTPSGCEA